MSNDLCGIRTWMQAELARQGLSDWTFVYDDARTRAGCCMYDRRQISMSRRFAAACPMDAVRDIAMHELAHALLPGEGHSRRWRDLAVSLGSRGTREHYYVFSRPQVLATCRCMTIAVWRHRVSRKLRTTPCPRCGCLPLVRKLP